MLCEMVKPFEGASLTTMSKSFASAVAESEMTLERSNAATVFANSPGSADASPESTIKPPSRTLSATSMRDTVASAEKSNARPLASVTVLPLTEAISTIEVRSGLSSRQLVSPMEFR